MPKQTEREALQIRSDDAVLSAVREWLAMFAPRPKPKLFEFMLEHACDDPRQSDDSEPRCARADRGHLRRLRAGHPA
jgi:hypothetical protein